ncbi:MAG: hypothetical protein ABR923_06070 [Terracidiphilus sp.]|jgi:hypothetical protein
MAVEQLSEAPNETRIDLSIFDAFSGDWTKYAACGALVAGAALILSQQRRAGLAVSCAGTALALLDQKDAVKACWDAIPGYLDQIESALAQVQDVVRDVADGRAKLARVIEP